MGVRVDARGESRFHFRAVISGVVPWLVVSDCSTLGDTGQAAALVLATREFVANDDGRCGVAPPRCCTAGVGQQPWPSRSAWPVVPQPASVMCSAVDFRNSGRDQRLRLVGEVPGARPTRYDAVAGIVLAPGLGWPLLARDSSRLDRGRSRAPVGRKRQ